MTVNSPHGLHMRPASLIAKSLMKFSCTVKAFHDGRTADGKSVSDLVMLEAPQGAVIRFEFSGEEAANAQAELCRLAAMNEESLR